MGLLKKIEISFRRFVTNKLSYKGSQTYLAKTDIISLPKSPKILLLRQDRLGDLVVSLPFLYKLKLAFPDSRLDIVLGKNYSGRSLAKPYTDNIYAYKGGLSEHIKTIRHIRGVRYDIVIDMLDTESATSSLLISLANSPIKVGFDKKNNHIYSHIIPTPDKTQIHIVDRINSILSYLNDESEFYKNKEVELADINLIKISQDYMKKAELALGEKYQKRLALVLTGSTKEKYLGRERFLQMVSMVQKDFSQWDICIFGTSQHLEDLEWIRDQALSRNISNVRYAPITKDFNLFLAMLNTSDMLITPDTSAVHIASVMNIPLVAYYTIAKKSIGKTVPMPWLPYKSEYEYILGEDSLSNLKVEDIASSAGILKERLDL